MEPWLENMRDRHFFSIMIDGATDSSVTELEIVYLRYVGDDGKPVNTFFSIEDVQHAHAHGILTAVNAGEFAFQIAFHVTSLDVSDGAHLKRHFIKPLKQRDSRRASVFTGWVKANGSFRLRVPVIFGVFSNSVLLASC